MTIVPLSRLRLSRMTITAIVMACAGLLAAPALAGNTATKNMTGMAATVCKIGANSRPTSQPWTVVLGVNGGNRSATIAGASSVTATASCNDSTIPLRITAPTASCTQNGNGNPFTFNYSVIVKVGGTGGTTIATVTSPATNTTVVTPPMASTTYTISINPNLPASQPGIPSNGTCTATTVSMSQP